ncbi:hypothetical protein [Streptomyces sp. NPDC051636]|uniref:hypothetical protein n=1 Tax=Streptomyces sp. NPDC051636 TaxID=3365663 RepID=UPI0037B995BF
MGRQRATTAPQLALLQVAARHPVMPLPRYRYPSDTSDLEWALLERLTDAQRDQVVGAVKDPTQNIFVASEYLAQLKAESGFADVPPEQMTREQMQELAARYNGGPYYQDPNAQAYGRGFDRKLDDAKEALR